MFSSKEALELTKAANEKINAAAEERKARQIAIDDSVVGFIEAKIKKAASEGKLFCRYVVEEESLFQPTDRVVATLRDAGYEVDVVTKNGLAINWDA